MTGIELSFTTYSFHQLPAQFIVKKTRTRRHSHQIGLGPVAGPMGTGGESFSQRRPRFIGKPLPGRIDFHVHHPVHVTPGPSLHGEKHEVAGVDGRPFTQEVVMLVGV